MLLTTKDLLQVAEEHNFTVGAFNVTELSNFKAVMAAAEELDAPVIIAVAEGEFRFCGSDYFEYLKHQCEKSKLPIALHLDHGHSPAVCEKAIQAGFTSVMIDASLKPYDENIKVTKEVVNFAHLCGVSVEGEIGTIGNQSIGDESEVKNEIIYSSPEQAVDFVSKTNCDLLAIAIGTSHGLYPKGKEPKLQIELLKRIKAVVNISLVLHGGSSNLDEEIDKACKAGIRKVNIASDYKVVMTQSIVDQYQENKTFKFAESMPLAIEKGKEIVKHKIKLFGSSGMAKYYK